MSDLFVALFDGARLTWGAARAAAGAAAADDARLTIVSRTPAPVTVAAGGRTTTADAVTLDAGLAEEAAYPVLLQSLAGAPVALVAPDPVVTAGLTAADAGRTLHGRLRTGAHAGRLRLSVVVGGRVVGDVAVDVTATKLPADAVRAMRDAVEAAAAGLALAAVRPAEGRAASAVGAPSAPGWLVAAETGVDEAARALASAARRPAAETVRAVALVRRSSIGRAASAETRRALARAGPSADVLPARPAVPTFDTPAHRWLAAAVDRARRRTARLRRAATAPSLRGAAVERRLTALAARLDALAALPLLAGADASRAPAVPPLALRHRPAYADAYAALRRLDTGLALRDGALDVAWQSLDALYETWTALAVVAAVADALGATVPPHPFGVARMGTRVTLQSGRRHGVRLDGPAGHVRIVRGPLFSGAAGAPALVRSRPDLYVYVRTTRGTVRRVVLDAKYRRDARPATVARYGTPAPPADALGALHRYRDAVRGPHGVAGWIDEAVALFPDTSPDWAVGRLWTSLGATGIGAVGVAPGHDAPLGALVARWLAG